MQSIKVKRLELLDTLRANRENHRKVFLEASEGYREAAIAELDKSLEAAKRGERIRRSIGLAEPMDQTREYDRAIRMLEMSVDTEITLSDRDFQQFVMDDWAWKEQFSASNRAYVKSGFATSYLAAADPDNQ